jgi:hypothetical protein
MPESVHLSAARGLIPALGVNHARRRHTAGTALFSNHMPPPNLKHLSARIAPRSVFFIYALHGTGGEEKQLNPKYYAAAGGPK